MEYTRLNRGMFSTVRLNWRTPRRVFAELDAEFHFDLDPCPDKDGPFRGTGPGWDGLRDEWFGTVFVNPPYGREIPKWTMKGVWELRVGRAKRIVWLVPCRTDTRWMQRDILPRATEIRFIRGRLHFDDGPAGAPFPSCIVVCE